MNKNFLDKEIRMWATKMGFTQMLSIEKNGDTIFHLTLVFKKGL